jgi:hypothetical protein
LKTKIKRGEYVKNNINNPDQLDDSTDFSNSSSKIQKKIKKSAKNEKPLKSTEN